MNKRKGRRKKRKWRELGKGEKDDGFDYDEVKDEKEDE